MKKPIVSLMLAGFVILNGVATFAAPIRPVGPVDVTGNISEVQWVPEKTVRGIPRMTGSAAKDRVVPPPFSGQAGGLRRGFSGSSGHHDQVRGMAG